MARQPGSTPACMTRRPSWRGIQESLVLVRPAGSGNAVPFNGRRFTNNDAPTSTTSATSLAHRLGDILCGYALMFVDHKAHNGPFS
jgi:hypothetical protein